MMDYPETEHRRLYCDGCGGNDFEGGDDGFFYCRNCGGQSQDVVDTGWADEDVLGASGGLYNFFHHRAHGQPQTPANAAPPPAISREELLLSLSQSIAASGVKKEGVKEEDRARKPDRSYGFEDDDEPSAPRDFSIGQGLPDAATLCDSIRTRYVQGLQVMLQLQCETLVEKFGVSPLICGLAGSIWLRYVAFSRVFDEGWEQKAIAESEAETKAYWKAQGQESRRPKFTKAKHRWEPHDRYGNRSIFIWCAALRTSLPLHSTLAIAFLVCHIAREAVLPTDIYDWASESKLPYLAAFFELDHHIVSSSSISVLSSRHLFRPFRVISPWGLEYVAGSIAHNVGLHLPSVNFYAIASRYLKDLSLPLEEILPGACRLYEWSTPAELWLSSNPTKLPTRVCAMAILIVTIRILYNVNGKGIWEETLSDHVDSTLGGYRSHISHGCLNLSSAKKFPGIDGNTKECYGTEGSLEQKHSPYITKKEISAKDLLCILETTYDSTCIRHDYSNDLRSYIMYCKDILFAGIPISYDEDSLIDRLWDIFENEKDDNLKESLKEETFDLNDKQKSEDGLPITPLSLSKDPCGESRSDQHRERTRPSRHHAGITGASSFFSTLLDPGEEGTGSLAPSQINDALSQMKRSMEDNGFQYLPPILQKKDGYVTYPKRKAGGRFIFAATADYYIVLRAFAKLARVDIRLLHLGVRKFERRLAWIEKRIDGSLDALSIIHSHKNGEC